MVIPGGPGRFFEEVGGVVGLVKIIKEAAKRDVIASDSKALSREQAEVWIKASDLREQVRELLGYSEEVMGSARWVGHLMKRLQLTDRTRRKAYADGQMHYMDRA